MMDANSILRFTKFGRRAVAAALLTAGATTAYGAACSTIVDATSRTGVAAAAGELLAAGAIKALGITAVSHSSTLLILTGPSGYIAGTIGAIGAAASFITAPAVIATAGIGAVTAGGIVAYCHVRART